MLKETFGIFQVTNPAFIDGHWSCDTALVTSVCRQTLNESTEIFGQIEHQSFFRGYHHVKDIFLVALMFTVSRMLHIACIMLLFTSHPVDNLLSPA